MECFTRALAGLGERLPEVFDARNCAVSRTAVVAFGGNALVTDAEHTPFPINTILSFVRYRTWST